MQIHFGADKSDKGVQGLIHLFRLQKGLDDFGHLITITVGELLLRCFVTNLKLEFGRFLDQKEIDPVNGLGLGPTECIFIYPSTCCLLVCKVRAAFFLGGKTFQRFDKNFFFVYFPKFLNLNIRFADSLWTEELGGILHPAIGQQRA